MQRAFEAEGCKRQNQVKSADVVKLGVDEPMLLVFKILLSYFEKSWLVCSRGSLMLFQASKQKGKDLGNKAIGLPTSFQATMHHPKRPKTTNLQKKSWFFRRLISERLSLKVVLLSYHQHYILRMNSWKYTLKNYQSGRVFLPFDFGAPSSAGSWVIFHWNLWKEKEMKIAWIQDVTFARLQRSHFAVNPNREPPSSPHSSHLSCTA